MDVVFSLHGFKGFKQFICSSLYLWLSFSMDVCNHVFNLENYRVSPKKYTSLKSNCLVAGEDKLVIKVGVIR